MPDFLGALPSYIGDVGRRRRSSRPAGSRYGRTGGYGGASASFAAASNRANQVAAMVRPDLAGAPARDAAILPAGWPTFSFALATGTNIVTQTMNVQTAYRGQRMVAIVLRNGASALVTAPLVQLFTVGMKPILTTGAVPLEIWSQTAFDTNVLLPPTVPGVIYTLGLSLATALTGTDTLTCLVGLVGSAVL